MLFFWRIFLSAWVILLLAIVLTIWVSGWLPEPGRGSGSPAAVDQIVTLVARDLREQLATGPAKGTDLLARDYPLDIRPWMQIYVLDPDGEDIRGRTLPEDVAAVPGTRGGSIGAPAAPLSPRLHVREDGLQGYLVVGRESSFPLSDIARKPWGRALFLGMLLAISAAASWMLARFIVLPVRRLRLAEQRVSGGDLSVRVAHTVGNRTDDIAKLAQDFDVMAERVDALLQSRHRLMRDVSHELRSPLARLQALLSIARQKARPVDADHIDRMEKEIERLDELIGEILAYSRLEAQDDVTRRPTDVVDLVQNIVDDASLEGQPAGKQLRMKGPGRCVVDLDSGLIQSALDNIVRNALKYTADGTAVDISIVDAAGEVRITVDDHGPGLPNDALARIFEPFYRVGESRSTQSGSGGIGLAIAERSVRLHGGRITARNREGGGLRVEVTVPRQNPSSPRHHADIPG